MAEQNAARLGKLFVAMGIIDVLVGAGLAIAALVGALGDGSQFVALFGGVIALTGVGLIVFGRNRMSQAQSRRGDLN